MKDELVVTNSLDGEAGRHEGLSVYIEKFEAAFDELHEMTVRYAMASNRFLTGHHDYPTMSILNSGFPIFHELGFYDVAAPRDYVGSLRPGGLRSIFIGKKPREVKTPKSTELAEFLENNDIGSRLTLRTVSSGSEIFRWQIEQLVGDAVERYLHLFGLAAPIDAKRRRSTLLPIIIGTLANPLGLRRVVPIAITKFDVDHFRLSDRAYIMRIPKKLQLARS